MGYLVGVVLIVLAVVGAAIWIAANDDDDFGMEIIGALLFFGAIGVIVYLTGQQLDSPKGISPEEFMIEVDTKYVPVRFEYIQLKTEQTRTLINLQNANTEKDSLLYLERALRISKDLTVAEERYRKVKDSLINK